MVICTYIDRLLQLEDRLPGPGLNTNNKDKLIVFMIFILVHMIFLIKLHAVPASNILNLSCI